MKLLDLFKKKKPTKVLKPTKVFEKRKNMISFVEETVLSKKAIIRVYLENDLLIDVTVYPDSSFYGRDCLIDYGTDEYEDSAGHLFPVKEPRINPKYFDFNYFLQQSVSAFLKNIANVNLFVDDSKNPTRSVAGKAIRAELLGITDYKTVMRMSKIVPRR